MEKNNKRFRIAVDIGGTFIDALIFDFKAGSLKIVKVPTTPKNPHEGVITGVDMLSKNLNTSESFFLYMTFLGFFYWDLQTLNEYDENGIRMMN
mgnify:CR=1 FL=1